MKNLLKFSLIMMLVTSVLFLASCGKDDDDDTTTPAVAKFTFLKSGNTWNYLMGQGGIVADTMEIKTISSMGAGKFLMNMEGDTNYWFMNDNEFGFYNDDNTYEIMCKADAKVNDMYTYIDGQDTSINKVAGLDVSVTTPAGTFKCYQIEQYYNSDLEGTFYLNKDYGIISFTEPSGMFIKLFNKNF